VKAPACPHCGEPLEGKPDPGPGREDPAHHNDHEPLRYDLEHLAAQAAAEKAYDETVKVRVTQEDIRKLVEKRKRKPK
jgi:hypothetical protein